MEIVVLKFSSPIVEWTVNHFLIYLNYFSSIATYIGTATLESGEVIPVYELFLMSI